MKAGMQNGMEYGMEHGMEYGMEYVGNGETLKNMIKACCSTLYTFSAGCLIPLPCTEETKKQVSYHLRTFYMCTLKFIINNSYSIHVVDR